MGAFLTGLIGLSAAVGFTGLVLLWVFIMLAITRRGGPDFADIATLVIEFVVSAGLMMFWLRNGSRIRRLGPDRRIMLAACCWVYAIVVLLVFAMIAGG